MTDTEGWIPHDGGEMPCDGEVLVDVILRSNYVSCGCQANDWAWDQLYDGTDIIFWRPHKNADGQAGREVEPVAWLHCDSGRLMLCEHFTPDEETRSEWCQLGLINPAPSPEGHAAGPACSAPDEALIEKIAERAFQRRYNGDFNQIGATEWAIREYIRRSAGKEKG